MNKIIKVIFKEGERTARVRKELSRYNYGQVLQVEGLALPDGNIEVHFSLTEYEGDANISIGSVKDNVLAVDIPDFIFQKEDVSLSTYDAYAFIYQTDEDSGRTIKKIVFTINARPKPTTGVPEPKQDPFLEEVRKVMQETKDIAQSVRDDADAGKFNGKDGKDGESGTGEIDEEQLLKLAIKTTTSPSPFHHITDSAHYRVLDFGMEGKTEQESTSGKNSFDVEKAKDENNYLRDEGTVQYYFFPVYIGAGNTFTFSWKLPTGNDLPDYTVLIMDAVGGNVINYVWYKGYEHWTKESYTLVSPNDYIYIRINKNELPPWWEDFTDIQIELGSVATEYEPFTNGPSPNPDYKQEVKNAGVYNEETGRYEIGCRFAGNNVADKNDWFIGCISNTAVGESFIVDDNSKYYCMVISVPKNTDVYLDTLSKDGTSNHRARVVLANENNIITAQKNYSPNTTLSWNVNTGDACKLAINLIDLSPEDVDVKVNLVSESDFNGYQSQSITLTSPVQLTKWDKLVKRDGVWGWSIWSGMTDDLASLVSGLYKNGEGNTLWAYVSIRAPFNYNRNNILTEVGTQTLQDYKPYVPMISGDEILIRANSNDTVETIKEHLHYKAQWLTYAEQSFHPLPDEEQTLLHNLETYYGVTNVYNEQGCPITLTYVNDTKLYVDKNLLEIQQAMI